MKSSICMLDLTCQFEEKMVNYIQVACSYNWNSSFFSKDYVESNFLINYSIDYISVEK